MDPMDPTSRLDESRPLVDLRERYVYSQQVCADLVGVSRSLWCAWEMGRRNISLEDIQRIRTAFCLPDEVFLQLVDHYGQGGRPAEVRPLPAWRPSPRPA